MLQMYNQTMKIRTRQIAHAGIFGSRDEPEFVSARDLEEIAETFADVHAAPVRLGSHWGEGRPRLGNVIAVRYDPGTQSLEADIEEHDVLAAAVDEGLYPDVSIGAKQRASDGKMYLHHLAYLGDTPPAIKDLYTQIEENLDHAADAAILAADDDDSRDFRTLPSARSVSLSDDDKNHKTPSNPTEKKQQKEGQSMTEEEIAVMKAENERLKAEAAAKEKLLSDRLAAERESDKQALKEAAAGRVTIPQMESLMELADSFEQGKTIELSDAEGRKTRRSPARVLADIFAGLPKKVEPGVLNLSDPECGTSQRENLASKMMGHV